MRALAGPAMLLVMVGGFAIYRGMAKDDAPSRDFLELEFAGADAGHTGSCYSLSTVLIANGVFGGAARTWTAATTTPGSWASRPSARDTTGRCTNSRISRSRNPANRFA